MVKSKLKKKGKVEIKKKRNLDSLWLLLIVLIFILFVNIVTQENELEKEAEAIAHEFTEGNKHSFAPDGVVHEEILEQISIMAYKELKDDLNVKNDFCVYFEDTGGNLVEVSDGIRSIGSSKIEINGKPCGR